MTFDELIAVVRSWDATAWAIASISAVLLVINVIALLNALTFPRLRRPHPDAPLTDPDAPGEGGMPTLVSVCIPARDEAAVIGSTLTRLLASDHPLFEVLLLDDGSTDGTADAARRAARGDPRLRILTGQPLPAGWLGKNWACHQLANAARGRLLVFTDADVGWEADALRALVGYALRSRADLVTVWSTQVTHSWGERLIVPLMAFVIMGYLPALAVHHTRFASLAAANGQVLLFRRRAYERIGGHMAVRGSIVEDIRFARLIKRRGGRLRMMDGNGRIACRMYDSWDATRRGFAKNIIAGYGGLLPFILGCVFHWAILLVPWALLLTGRGAALIPIGLGIAARAITAAATRQRIADALLLPISALLMSAIALQALVWHIGGGPRWKGRIASVGKS
jgi:chlorobactene glucosyltransferase